MIDADLLDGALTVPFVVTDTVPEGPVVVTDQTRVIARAESSATDASGWEPASFEDIGGLEDTLSALRDSVVLPL